jgi:hypothetical protein
MSVYHHWGLVDTNVKDRGLSDTGISHYIYRSSRQTITNGESCGWCFFSVSRTVQCDNLLCSVLIPQTHINPQDAPYVLVRKIFYLVILTLQTIWSVQPFLINTLSFTLRAQNRSEVF